MKDKTSKCQHIEKTNTMPQIKHRMDSYCISSVSTLFVKVKKILYSCVWRSFYPLQCIPWWNLGLHCLQKHSFRVFTNTKGHCVRNEHFGQIPHFHRFVWVFATCIYRGQKYFNIALVLQDNWLTIFTCPENTCTCPLKAYAIKNTRE